MRKGFLGGGRQNKGGAGSVFRERKAVTWGQEIQDKEDSVASKTGLEQADGKRFGREEDV